MIGNWKKGMVLRLQKLFETKRNKKEKRAEKEQEQLHRKVG